MKRMKKLISAEAKQIDLVDYLGVLSHYPQKVNNKDYWYRSPLRIEKTPGLFITYTFKNKFHSTQFYYPFMGRRLQTDA